MGIPCDLKKSNYIRMNIIIKTAEQIDGIGKSSRLAGETLLYIEPFIKKGVTTEYLDSLIHQFMVGRRAIPATLDYNGFPKSCCISLNEVVCHGIPSPHNNSQKRGYSQCGYYHDFGWLLW